MAHWTIVVTLAALAAPCVVPHAMAQIVGPKYPTTGLTNVFVDHFSYTSADAVFNSTWKPEFGDGTGDPYNAVTWGNGELQCYTDSSENIRFMTVNGRRCLMIQAQHRPGRPCRTFTGEPTVTSPNFTSARLTTRGCTRRNCVGGFRWPDNNTAMLIETNVRVPYTPAAWPAFWMLPMPNTTDTMHTNEYGGWCKSGEIDIMEHKNSDPLFLQVLHFANSTSTCTVVANKTSRGPQFGRASGFHKFSVLWNATSLTFYVNNVINMHVPSSRWRPADYPFDIEGDANAPFDRKFYLILNLAVGGGFVGAQKPDPTKMPFAWRYLVDYVRVATIPQRLIEG